MPGARARAGGHPVARRGPGGRDVGRASSPPAAATVRVGRQGPQVPSDTTRRPGAFTTGRPAVRARPRWGSREGRVAGPCDDCDERRITCLDPDPWPFLRLGVLRDSGESGSVRPVLPPYATTRDAHRAGERAWGPIRAQNRWWAGEESNLYSRWRLIYSPAQTVRRHPSQFRIRAQNGPSESGERGPESVPVRAVCYRAVLPEPGPPDGPRRGRGGPRRRPSSWPTLAP